MTAESPVFIARLISRSSRPMLWFGFGVSVASLLLVIVSTPFSALWRFSSVVHFVALAICLVGAEDQSWRKREEPIGIAKIMTLIVLLIGGPWLLVGSFMFLIVTSLGKMG